MKICIIHNLCLPKNTRAENFDVLFWALDDMAKKEAQSVIFTGQTVYGDNKTVKKELINILNERGVSYEIIQGADALPKSIAAYESVLCKYTANPDTACEYGPCITYFDTETKTHRYAYRFSPVPPTLFRYVCPSFSLCDKNVLYIIKNDIKYAEILCDAALFDDGAQKLIDKLLQNSVSICIAQCGDALPCDVPPAVLDMADSIAISGASVTKEVFDKLAKIEKPLNVYIKNGGKNNTPKACIDLLDDLSKKAHHRVSLMLDIDETGADTPLCVWLCEAQKYISAYRIPKKNPVSQSGLYKSLLLGKIPFCPIVCDIDDGYFEMVKQQGQKRVFDIHSHTYYSNCGRDNPHDLIKAVISNGVSVFGISDHNYGIAQKKAQYQKEITALKEEYKDKIKILCGIELSTLSHLYDLDSPDEIKDYDYLLFEHILDEGTIVDDLFEFAQKFNIPCGIAHTDMFLYCDKHGYDYEEFFTRLARHKIFWEMNVTYDSIHRYNEHAYVNDFMTDKQKLDLIRRTGVYVSVGNDSHRCEDYDGYKVHKMYDFLTQNGINTALELF